MMSSSTASTKGDYNAKARGRAPLLLAAVGLALGAAMLPMDGPVAEFCRRLQDGGDLRLGGDVRRTLMFLQQFGDLASSILVGIVILLLDPGKKRRVADWIGAALVVALLVQALKMLIGRPRPGIIFGTPKPGFEGVVQFVGPLGTYPLPRDIDSAPGMQLGYFERHAWEFWNGISSDLWSMPSSHTSAAAVLAVALAKMYPRLTPLVVVLACIVGVSRVMFGAHFPSDVVVGGAVGAAAAWWAMDAGFGGRMYSRLTGNRQ